MGFPPLLNLSTKLSTAALPSQTTKTALTLEFMFQNVAYRPTVYITGGVTILTRGKLVVSQFHNRSCIAETHKLSHSEYNKTNSDGIMNPKDLGECNGTGLGNGLTWQGNTRNSSPPSALTTASPYSCNFTNLIAFISNSGECNGTGLGYGLIWPEKAGNGSLLLASTSVSPYSCNFTNLIAFNSNSGECNGTGLGYGLIWPGNKWLEYHQDVYISLQSERVEAIQILPISNTFNSFQNLPAKTHQKFIDKSCIHDGLGLTFDEDSPLNL